MFHFWQPGVYDVAGEVIWDIKYYLYFTVNMNNIFNSHIFYSRDNQDY